MLETDGRLVGRVQEDCGIRRFFQLSCLGTSYQKADEWDAENLKKRFTSTPKHTMRYTYAFCGRVNNCCDATCLRSDVVFDVLDQEGNVVAYIQQTCGDGEGGGALHSVFSRKSFA